MLFSHALECTVVGLLKFTEGHLIYSVTIMPCTFKQMVSQGASAGQKGSVESIYPLVRTDMSARFAKSLADQHFRYSLHNSRNWCCFRKKSKDLSYLITQRRLSRSSQTWTAVTCHHLCIRNY